MVENWSNYYEREVRDQLLSNAGPLTGPEWNEVGRFDYNSVAYETFGFEQERFIPVEIWRVQFKVV